METECASGWAAAVSQGKASATRTLRTSTSDGRVLTHRDSHQDADLVLGEWGPEAPQTAPDTQPRAPPAAAPPSKAHLVPQPLRLRTLLLQVVDLVDEPCRSSRASLRPCSRMSRMALSESGVAALPPGRVGVASGGNALTGLGCGAGSKEAQGRRQTEALSDRHAVSERLCAREAGARVAVSGAP